MGFNRAPPSPHGRGVCLDGTLLGGSRSGQRHTGANDILSGRRPASIFPRLLSHAAWTRSIPPGPAGPQRGRPQTLFANAAPKPKIHASILEQALASRPSFKSQFPYEITFSAKNCFYHLI